MVGIDSYRFLPEKVTHEIFWLWVAQGLHVGFGFREPLDTESTMRTSSDACSLYVVRRI